MDPHSMLAKMFAVDSPMKAAATDENGAYFIDRDPKYFRAILNFLRDPSKLIIDSNLNMEGVLQEARYFQVQLM